MNVTQLRHALGIAEFHAPRSQMMRCIDYPTMLKDGSGWGAMAGVSAAYLAADGFTGAPARFASRAISQQSIARMRPSVDAETVARWRASGGSVRAPWAAPETSKR